MEALKYMFRIPYRKFKSPTFLPRRVWRNIHTPYAQLMNGHPLAKRTLHTLFWLPGAIWFTESVGVIRQVNGTSMQPTLNPNSSPWRDIVIFDRTQSWATSRYERGDIVAVWSPSDPNRLFVKRIIALAGDIVKTLPPYPDSEVRVPEGHVWIEGDERFHSDDSNKFGPVPVSLIDSKLVYIIFPLGRIGPVTSRLKSNSDLPKGRAWREEMAEIERQKWRESRVTMCS